MRVVVSDIKLSSLDVCNEPSSPIPLLNLLPTLTALDQFGLLKNSPLGLIHNLLGLWAQNVFNGKPLWTGDITKLEISAWLPLGGAVTYNYDFKGKGWQKYPLEGAWWRKILYGY